MTIETKKNKKTSTDNESINIENYPSKINDIDINVNNNYERTSEKFKLNNLYLKCDPVNYINYSKNKLKNYLPKFYFSDKKAIVNIVEAYFEINQADFKFGNVNK